MPWAERLPDATNQFRLETSPFYAYRVSPTTSPRAKK
jgi:hypothetical protein